MSESVKAASKYAPLTAAITAGIVAAWAAITGTPTAQSRAGYETLAAAHEAQTARIQKLELAVHILLSQRQALELDKSFFAGLAAPSAPAAPAPVPSAPMITSEALQIVDELDADFDSVSSEPPPSMSPDASILVDRLATDIREAAQSPTAALPSYDAL